MQARGLLMIEHRLIERMIALIKDAYDRIQSSGRIDPLFVDTAVDFILVYADKNHHGKEEDILFRDLGRKNISPNDRRMMNELIEDHAFGRETTKALIASNMRYRNGNAAALADIAGSLNALVGLYPKHIDKEDKVFFPASKAYFSDEEDQAMLAEFQEFDRKMFHEKYKAVVESLGG